MDTTRKAVDQLGTWIADNASPTGIDLYNKAIKALLTRAEAAEVKAVDANRRATDMSDRYIAEYHAKLAAEAERDALAAKLALAVEALTETTKALDDIINGEEFGESDSKKARARLHKSIRTIAQLTADTIPDRRIEGWNSAIEAAAELYEGQFDRLARLIRTMPCHYTPKESKDHDQ